MNLYPPDVEQALTYFERTIPRLREGSHPNPDRAAYLLSYHAGVLVRAADRGELGPFA